MKKIILEILRLLSKAIEQNTVNTYQEQGAIAAGAVFAILQEAERKISELEKPTEKGGSHE